jgi:hypothetical protein
VSGRSRGFVLHWTPRPERHALLETILTLLDHYAERLQLTIRLVGRHSYEKSERAYERLVELLNKARRARARLCPSAGMAGPRSRRRA